MKEKKESIGVLFIILFVVGMIVWVIIFGVQESKANNYCWDVFPSKLSNKIFRSNDWAEMYSAEEGYIKCCRHYVKNHAILKECKIFEKLKDNATNNKCEIL